MVSRHKGTTGGGNLHINLRKLGDSYLSHRKVKVGYDGEEHVKEANKGCVQASIDGPIFRNLLIDLLLKGPENRATLKEKGTGIPKLCIFSSV